MQLGPLQFEPKLSPKVWGGSRLARYGKALPQGKAIGESWDLYDRPGESAVVAQGPFKGSTLNALMAEFGPGLLGAAAFEAGARYFPLMVKLIDAQDALSVQVHPDDAQALSMVGPDELGKTEMWVVLEAEPGSRMCAGLKRGCDREQFAQALRAGKLEGLLNEFEVKAGDVIFVPAGRVHAIGKGCLVAEIQQNSDTTWRVYDYGRLENGKPRDLHVSQALDCIRFDPEMAGMPSLAPSRRISGEETLLVECPYFTVRRLELKAPYALPRAGECYQILTVLGGELRLSSGESRLQLQRGATVLIPAGLSCALEPLGGPASLLWTRP